MSYLTSVEKLLLEINDELEEAVGETNQQDVFWSIMLNKKLNVYSKNKNLLCFEFFIKKIDPEVNGYLLTPFMTINLSLCYGSIKLLPTPSGDINVYYSINISACHLYTGLKEFILEALEEYKEVVKSSIEGEKLLHKKMGMPKVFNFDNLEKLLEEPPNETEDK